MMRKLLVIMAMALVLCGTMAMSAHAIFLDFELAHGADNTGLVSYGGAGVPGDAPLVGTGLVVTEVLVDGSTGAIPNGIHPVVNGLLNFTTGNFNSAPGFTYVFDAGGSVTLAGTVLGFNIGMVGTFSEAVVLSQNSDPDTTHVGTFNFTDTKDPNFVEIGLGATNPLTGDIFLGFITPPVSPGDGFDSTLINGFRVHNVPVPPAVWLFGSGLLGLAGLRFRKNRA